VLTTELLIGAPPDALSEVTLSTAELFEQLVSALGFVRDRVLRASQVGIKRNRRRNFGKGVLVEQLTDCVEIELRAGDLSDPIAVARVTRDLGGVCLCGLRERTSIQFKLFEVLRRSTGSSHEKLNHPDASRRRSLLWMSTAQAASEVATVEASAPVAEAGAIGAIKGSFTSFKRVKTKGETSQRDVVVYLQAAKETEHKAPTKPVVIKQERLNFFPHVAAILKGTPVHLVNEDMGAGSNVDVNFTEPGVASVICRLHPDMSLWILVLENPWFQALQLEKIKGDSGSRYTADFEITDVPPGDYTLTFWNKKLAPETYPITIEAGKTLDFNIEIAK